MIVTEEEAKTKRCQESYGPPITTDGASYAAASPFGHGMNFGAGMAVATSPSMCIGSACMAWRQTALIENGPLHEIAAPRSGYCGKAGRP